MVQPFEKGGLVTGSGWRESGTPFPRILPATSVIVGQTIQIHGGHSLTIHTES
jgi:hypothetical protein